MPIAGHVWTVAPWLWHAARGARLDGARPWSREVSDERWGRVRITGVVHGAGEPGRPLLVLLHGLGGCVDSYYMPLAARAGLAAGFDVVRLNFRGADRSGEDLYHAGLTSDVAAALRDPAFDAYDRVALLGFSMGGHAALRYATRTVDPRVRAVAAVCAPLDLARTVDAFDRDVPSVYRRHVLSGLVDMWTRVAERRGLPGDTRSMAAIRGIREWDEKTVVPRFGFRDVDEYYGTQSVGPRLGSLRVPSLIVAAEHDPMILADTLRPSLRAAGPLLEVRWSPRGGHVGFPPRVDLGLPGRPGLAGQVTGWLAGRAARGAPA